MAEKLTQAMQYLPFGRTISYTEFAKFENELRSEANLNDRFNRTAADMTFKIFPHSEGEIPFLT